MDTFNRFQERGEGNKLRAGIEHDSELDKEKKRKILLEGINLGEFTNKIIREEMRQIRTECWLKYANQHT